MRQLDGRTAAPRALGIRASEIVGMAIVLTLFASGVAFAQAKDDASQVLKGSAAFGDWHQDKPGVKRLLTPHDLPATSAPTYGAAEIVPMPAGAKTCCPAGLLGREGDIGPR